MLAKLNRIKKKKDFETIFKKGKSLKSGFLVLRALKNDLKQNRFAFVVSQKVSKKATARNKVRRRLSEIIKTNLKNIKDGFDIVFVALPGIEKKEFLEIKVAAEKLLNHV
jgi:ribonuclease P protein component